MTNIKQFEPLWGVWRTEGKPLGEGSFGVVYRAVREEFGKKYYAAVKHISIPSSESQIDEAIFDGIPDDEESLKYYFKSIAQNLVNEIALMNEVKGHTNIVSYEDHMIVPRATGIGYDIIIRMELLTGLNELLRRRQMTNSDVINLGIDICSALEVCVEKGIVHRDIKPSNIFMNDLGDYKLGDFGVARELEHTTAGMSKKGTYVYMAPEVYRGEPANFTADIYSLGIIMYRLLNGGRVPFVPVGTAKINPGDNENALGRRMAGEPLPAPAFADDELAKVILMATQFDKSKRFATPTEFKAALKAVRDGVSVERSIPVFSSVSNDSSSQNSRSSRSESTEGSSVRPEPEMESTRRLPLSVAPAADSRIEATRLNDATVIEESTVLEERTVLAADAGKKEAKKFSGASKALIIAACAVLAVLAAVCVGVYSAKIGRFNDALTQMSAGKYSEAYDIFCELGGFNDSSLYATKCLYYKGITLVNEGNYSGAMAYFESVKSSVEYYRKKNPNEFVSFAVTRYKAGSQLSKLKEEYRQAKYDLTCWDTDKLTPLLEKLSLNAGYDKECRSMCADSVFTLSKLCGAEYAGGGYCFEITPDGAPGEFTMSYSMGEDPGMESWIFAESAGYGVFQYTYRGYDYIDWFEIVDVDSATSVQPKTITVRLCNSGEIIKMNRQ